MKPFITHSGLVLPLDRVNVDTDQMVPKQFLKALTREGFGRILFYDWRYTQPGEKPNPDFILNKPEYKGASVLLTRANFGCGSSREHAPWAIGDYGFRVILAPSYADIFYNNCFKNGILPIVVSPENLKKLLDDADRGSNATITIDLPKQEIRGPDGGTVQFDIDPFRKHCLLNGLDDIALSLEKVASIDAFEKKQAATQSWL